MRAAPAETPPDDPEVSLEEWFDLDEDDPRELVEGRLAEAEMPGGVHETAVGWLLVELGIWARTHRATALPSGLKYAVGPKTGRMPDLSVFLDGRRPPAQGLVRSAPDIAVEVVSTGLRDVRRDRVEKLAEYARFGVKWYWIVDPGLRTFEVLELRDGLYAHVGAEGPGVVTEIPGCPDLVLDLDALWAEIDQLTD